MRIPLLLILFFISAVSVTALDCPIGLINDTAPGSCGLYTDKNTDNICDLSQPTDSCDTNLTATDLTSNEIKAMTVEQVAEHYNIEGEKFAEEISKIAGIKVKKSDSFQILHDQYAVRPVSVREIALSMQKNTTTVTTQNHYIILIILLTTILYITTWFLSKKEKITTQAHRKIWNWILFITFIPTLVTSLLWLLRVEWGIILRVPFNIEYWHIIFGMIMIMISIFHIIWHTKYYFKIPNKVSGGK
jgi:cation transport ATPase